MEAHGFRKTKKHGNGNGCGSWRGYILSYHSVKSVLFKEDDLVKWDKLEKDAQPSYI